jgi:uncharacterized membrane protein
MASKSKQKRLKEQKRKESATIAVLISIVAAALAIVQNKYGQFSDIRGFYGMHFSDGQHLWPFSTHQLLGAAAPIHPVEYPALTGLIMWFLSFFVEPAQLAWVDYFRLTAIIHIGIFSTTTYYIQKLSNRKWAIFFALSPATLYSLNRNWDIWAIITMILAIYFFEKGRTRLSAVILAISIATKFFPLVLLLPIAIIYFRKKELPKFFEYFGVTVGAWLAINVPFMLINFRGWSYFYEFNFSRGLGSASVFEILGILFPGISISNPIFYLLNLLILGIIIGFYISVKKNLTLTEAAFFTMFAFILFNKQYSMQYIIWLTALAVLTLSKLNKKNQNIALVSFIGWQVFDLVFQYSFFQNILTNMAINNGTEISGPISTQTYGNIGAIRYILAVTFFALLGVLMYREKSSEIAPVKR